MPLRSFPIGAISYTGGLLRVLCEIGPCSVQEVASAAPAEELFPQGTKDPERRLGSYAAVLRLFHLATVEAGRWEATNVGRRYSDLADPDQRFSVSESQAEVLREVLEDHSNEDVFRTALIALAAARDAPGWKTSVEFGTLFAQRGRQESWDTVTFRAQGWRYATLLRDMGLIDEQRQLTPMGEETLNRHAESFEKQSATPGAAVRAWTIRAGESGGAESLALSESVTVIGWHTLGELRPELTRDDLKEMIHSTYGETRPHSLGQQASQIFRFINDVSEGDLVVLPLKTKPGRVAVGRVVGTYEFRQDQRFADVDAQHTRRVDWLAEDLDSQRFDPDIRSAFGLQGTLREITKPDAVARIEAVLGGADFSAVHLVIKWSERSGTDAVAEHRALADEHGEVWWGLIEPDETPKLADKWVQTIREQLGSATETLVFIVGPTNWKTRLTALETARVVDEKLVPSYYPRDLDLGLWLKLADFEPVERSWLPEHLQLASGRALTEGSLRNGSNPLIVQRAAGVVQSRRVWWVCQGQTYPSARELGILWAPQVAKDGSGRAYWRALQDARVGDLVIHYSDSHVRAVSTVVEEAVEAPQPQGVTGNWTDGDGWLVEAAYRELPSPVPLTEIPIGWRTDELGPFTKQGSVQQGYFFPLSDRFVNQLAGSFPQLGLGSPTVTGGTEASISYLEPSFKEIATAIKGKGLLITERNLRRYHLSLKTRGFVVLAGVSGSGKTWLAEAYADAVGAEQLRVPVAPNWTTNEDLLGYLNPLDSKYRHTEFSSFLQRASIEYSSSKGTDREARPFHLILDELNLARVEYYFAKFLSAMEARSRYGTAPIQLSADLEVQLAPNLKFVGTVNIDETTFGFSDKVFDRAQLIELDAPWSAIADHTSGAPYQPYLKAIWDASHVVAPFAFRVVDELASYVAEAELLDVRWQEAFDDQILQKVLPKIRGTDPRIREALEGLVAATEEAFPLSNAKARAMLTTFSTHGFVSYF